MRVRTARKLLKRFTRYDQKIFIIVVVGDESWLHYFEPLRKINKQVWLNKMQKGLVLLQRLPVRKRLCMPYFSFIRD